MLTGVSKGLLWVEGEFVGWRLLCAPAGCSLESGLVFENLQSSRDGR